MKKYSVYVKLNNGQDMQIETDTNVKMVQPVEINDGRFIVTEEEYFINVDHIEELNVVELNK